VRFPALAFAIALSLALPGEAKLGDRHGLVELCHGAEHLAHQRRGRPIFNEGSGAVGGDDLDALLTQHSVAGFLNDQIASKAICTTGSKSRLVRVWR
jgi:hypothetical protein